MRREKFANSAIHMGYVAYFLLRMRETVISTFSPQSDVTIVFLDPNFLNYAQISAICVHLRHI